MYPKFKVRGSSRTYFEKLSAVFRSVVEHYYLVLKFITQHFQYQYPKSQISQEVRPFLEMSSERVL